MNYIKQYWLQGVLVLQFILIITSFWFLTNRLNAHESVINNQGNTLTQVVQFLQQATKKQ